MKEITTQFPDDWDQVQVGDIAKVKGGRRLPFGFYVVDTPTPYPYLRVVDMYPGGVNQSNIKYVPEKAFPAIQNYRIYSKDIFISVAGSLGIVGVVPPELSGANLTENANYITDLQCDRDYLKYWLMSHPIQNAVKLIQTTGAQPKLALGRIAKFVVALPQDIKEQRAIAEVLSDVDGLINALDTLIAKKRAIKQATMQQLLTGKTRLPGFSGEWETKRLGEISDVNPQNFSSNTNPDYKFNYITLEQVDSGKLLGYSEEVFRSAPSRAQRVLQNGDVLMSTVRPNLMAHLFFQGQVPNAVCSTGFAVLRAKHDLSIPYFLFSQLFSEGVNDQIDKILSGSNYPAINSRDVKLIEIPCPPTVAEQHAIAAVLSDMDADISALEQRRDKTIAIKQGMMQQLLTGKVRLLKSG